MFKSRMRAVVHALILIAATLSAVFVPVSPAGATNDLTLSASGPATVLITSPSAFTVDLTATNPVGGNGNNGYNGSFRVVLPAGVSLASATPAPTASIPNGGETVLLFTNVGDIQEGSTLGLSLNLTASAAVHPVGSTVTINSGFYASEDPRAVPDFNGPASTASGDFDGFATTSFATTIVPIDIEKTSPTVGAENEMLRGLHDQVNTYHLDVTNNGVATTDNVIVHDYVPANLEFLGCGGVDNTTDASTNPGSSLEYPGAPALTATTAPAGPCPAPALVEMVSVSSGVITSGTASNGSAAPTGMADGVYTHVRWDLATMAINQLTEIEYRVAIPIRENVYVSTMNTAGGTADPTANLDNNSGPHTNETASENQARNWATVGGTSYTGPVAFPGAENAQDVDDFIVSVEDLSIHKSVVEPSPVLHGSVANYTLLVETGEYRTVSNMTIIDVMPDGLCPLLGGADPETTAPISGDCAGAGPAPSPSLTSLTENSDGTWSLQWDFSTVGALTNLNASSSTTLTYSAKVRESYQESFADAAPVNGADGFNNTVTMNGFKNVINAGPRNISADNNTDNGMQIFDTSSAEFVAGTPQIDKSVSVPTAAGVALSCDSATWVRTNPAGSASPGSPATLVGAPYAYRPGDRVCYRLGVDLETALNYRNTRVDDFMPAGYTFEQFWGTTPGNGATASNNTVIDSVSVTGDLITWSLGEIDPDTAGSPFSSDLFINNGATRFEVVFSAIVGSPTGRTTPDIVSNLEKFTSANINGSTVSLRDAADVQLVQPQLTITKDDFGADVVKGGDTVNHRVTVTNNFSASSASSSAYVAASATAYGASNWDILPFQISCSDIVGFNGVEPSPAGITLNVPGTVDYCHNSVAAVGSRSVIAWTITSLAPGENAQLDYTYTVPAGIGFSANLLNLTGIRQYVGGDANNGGVPQTFTPGTGTNNIDPSLTPNIADALANTQVVTPGLTVTKEHQSQHDDNVDQAVAQNSNLANAGLATTDEEATIGEFIDYRIRGTIPSGVSVYNATLGDTFPAGLEYVSLTSATLYRYAGDPGIPAVPNGFALNQAGQTVELNFPATYTAGANDAPASGPDEDDIVELVIRLRVSDIPANAAGSTLSNRADFRAAKAPGGSLILAQSSNRTTTVVEPAPQVTKTARNSGGTVVGNVGAGETISYTIVVTNPSTAAPDNVSNAYDLVVTDVLPAGVTISGAASGGVFTAGGGATEGTLVWDAATIPALSVLAPDATVTITYDVIVDDPAISASQLTNTVSLTATSLSGTPTGERTTYADNDTATLTLPLATLAKDEFPFGGADTQTYAVGDTAEFQLTVGIPAGTRIFQSTIFDTLPAEVDFDSYGTITINNCQLISNAGLPGESLAPLTTGDIVNLTPNGQILGWFVGDVEARDAGGIPADCTITAEYQVHVNSTAITTDTPANQAILAWENAPVGGATPAAVSDLPAPPTDGNSGTWDGKTPQVADDIDILEPALAVDKDVTLSGGATLLNPTCDTTPGNNTAGSNDLDGTPANGCDIEAGARLTYSVVVSNSGDGAAHDITMVNNVPTGLTPIDTATGSPVANGANVVGTVPAFPGVWDSAARTITWTLSTIAAAGNLTLDYDVILDPSNGLTDGQDLSNSIDIPTYFGLPSATRTLLVTNNPANNDIPTYGDSGTRGPVEGDVVTVEVHFPDLAVVKTHVAPSDDTDARLDQPFNWLLTITNNDETATAFNLDVVDALPTGWTYVPNSAVVTFAGTPTSIEPACTVASGACNTPADNNSEGLFWTDVRAALAPGESFTIALQAIPQSAALTPDAATGIANTGWDTGAGNAHVNSVIVSGDDASGSSSCCDPDGAGPGFPVLYEASTSDTVYIRRADLEVAKSVTPVDADGNPANGPHWFGSFIEYTISITNQGPDTALDVVVEDALDRSALIYSSVTSIDQGTFTQTGGSGAQWGEWNVGSIPSGTTLNLVVRMQIGALGAIDNLAEVTETSTYDPDSDPDNSVFEPGEDDTDSVQITSVPTMLGDRVWLDTNGDGLQAGESGIPDVTVTVTYNDPITGAAVTSSTITDLLGNYGFTNLPSNVPITVAIDYGNTVLNPNLAGLDPSYDLDGGLNQSAIATIDPASDPTGSGTPGRLDVDFGFTDSAGAGQSLGNRVWWDQNNSADASDGSGEFGLPAVTVTALWAGFDGIFGNADDQTYTTDTDATGTYLFDTIPPGEYQVSVDNSDIPLGLRIPTFDQDGVATPNTVNSITILPNENQLDVDFSYRGNGSIGDRVWYDLDGDGIQDADEFGIAGATVTLIWTDPVSGQTATLTTTTGADGTYLFENLPFGDYVVTVDPATLPAGLVQTFDADGLGSPLQSSLSLSVGNNTNLDQDFGFRGTGSIGDTVWFDADNSADANLAGSGVFAAGDTAIVGVDVSLTWAGPDNTFGTADDYVYTAAAYGTTTDANGEYLFGNLPFGDYRVLVDDSMLPAGQDEATFDDDGIASPNQSETTISVATPDDLDQDFSYTGSSELGNFVWIDENGNGIQDAGEAPVSGLTVTLYKINPVDLANPVLLRTMDTLADGSYLFDNLDAGDYVVVFDQLANHVPTGTTAGSNTAVDSNGRVINNPTSPFDTMLATPTISLGAGTSDLTWDQGFYQPAELGDIVWLDSNVNGVQDGAETGVSGVTVNLMDEAGKPIIGAGGNPVTTTTGADGSYLFTNLVPGVYTVQFVAPPSHVFTLVDQGGNDGVDSDAGLSSSPTPGLTGPITLTSGDSNLTVDAGIFDDAVIGDKIWEDYDQDGIQDTNEPGISGITVTLEAPGLDGIFGNADDVLVATTTTSATGNYLFTELVPGEYRVRINPTTLPTDMVITSQNAGTDDAIDSDADTTSGYLASVTLAMGDEDLSHDAGVYVPYDLTIAKTVSATSAAQGAVVNYSITVSNVGPGDVHEVVTVRDPLPAGLSFVSVSTPTGWTCSQANNVVTCLSGSTIPANTKATISIKALITAKNGVSILNTVQMETVSTIGIDGPNDIETGSAPILRINDSLARTGNDSQWLVTGGLLLVGMGGLLLLLTGMKRAAIPVLVSRRREDQ